MIIYRRRFYILVKETTAFTRNARNIASYLKEQTNGKDDNGGFKWSIIVM